VRLVDLSRESATDLSMRERWSRACWIVLSASLSAAACGSSDDAGLLGGNSGVGGKQDAGLGGTSASGGAGGSAGVSLGGTSGVANGGTAGEAAGGAGGSAGGEAGAPAGGTGGTGGGSGAGGAGGGGVYGIGACPDTQPPEGFSCGADEATCCYTPGSKVLVCGGGNWKTHPVLTCCPAVAPGIGSACSIPPQFNCCYPTGKYDCVVGIWTLTVFGDCTNS
jgi:hypothetical protein